MKNRSNTPLDAAATILVKPDLTKVLWARRNPKLRFLGGYHGFTGGKVDDSDRLADVRNSTADMARLIACAARETFEETGVLLTRGGDKLTAGQIVSLHDDLVSGRNTFAEILSHWGLHLDANDFHYAGTWTTPEFSPIRFKTRFFVVTCPAKQQPYSATEEMLDAEFIDPKAALKKWEKAEVLIAPPVLYGLRGLSTGSQQDIKTTAEKLRIDAETADSVVEYMELNSRIICFPLRTKTLPPATHTNCFIVGKKRFVVIDAATNYEDEQQKLFQLTDEMIEDGNECVAIIVSHLHRDHFGAEMALKRRINKKYGIDVPVLAHRITAESLEGKVDIDNYVADNDTYNLKDSKGGEFQLRALHTPGHARGHLCFYDEEIGFLLSCDNVVGLGTVVIAPPEGNMTDYLGSLRRMEELPNLRFLCGSHGAAIADGKGRIRKYIDHRMDRENTILQLVMNGTSDVSEIVSSVYDGLEPELIPLAEKSVEAHLEKLANENRISI